MDGIFPNSPSIDTPHPSMITFPLSPLSSENPVAETQLKALRPRHEAILNWIVANPERSMGECAVAFGVSRSWLSIIVNSQAFRDRMQERQEEVFTEVVVPLRDKMAGVAHRAYERIAEKIDCEGDIRTLLEIADKTAHRLGYAPTRGPEPAPGAVTNVQQNNYFVSKEALDQARGRILEAAKETHALPLPKELPASR